MSFNPVVVTGGLAGLRLLDASLERQLDVFGRRPDVARAAQDFIDRAGTIESAEALVADRQLLEVALSAFGLEDELPKRALIRRVLEEGTLDPRGLANRLVDPAWRRFSDALAFDTGGRLVFPDVRREIADAYVERQFERAVGDRDLGLRLALNFRREIQVIAEAPEADRSGWFRIIGSEPLRLVVFGALGLPESSARLDVDVQVEELAERAERQFGSGSPTVFTDAETREEAIRLFLLRRELEQGPSGGAPAVGLAQGGIIPVASPTALSASGGVSGGSALDSRTLASLILSG
ncbi:MAG: DUF1217 domain-containing protein [Pseudomonadota bacterium]